MKKKKGKCTNFLRGQTGTEPISCQVSKDNRIKGKREKENEKEVFFVSFKREKEHGW
jgi:hypothetical protein